MSFLYLKAIHIIFIVMWFAGLFYLPRLLVYLIESHSNKEPEKSILLKQLLMMASRLWYGITWPSAVITMGMGVALLMNQPQFLQQGYMHIKLILVLLLFGYHMSLHFLFRQLKRGVVLFTSQQVRFWNEVATLLLISIVFIIVLKNVLSMVWGLVGLIIVTILIIAGMKLYRKFKKDD